VVLAVALWPLLERALERIFAAIWCSDDLGRKQLGFALDVALSFRGFSPAGQELAGDWTETGASD